MTQMPVYFMDYPGDRSVKPTDGRYLSEPFTYQQYLPGASKGFDAEHVAGVLPADTRIQFLGVSSSSSYMTDTHVTYRGKILDGRFAGKTVTMNALIDSDNAPGVPPALLGKYLYRATR